MSTSESKSKPASPRKLQQQRSKGNLPLVADVSALLTSALILVVLSLLAPYLYERLIATFQVVDRAMTMPFIEAMNLALRDITFLLFISILPFIGIAIAISVMTTLIYNGGVVFSLNPISPKFDRMSPDKGLSRMFGRRSFVETGVSAARLTLWFGLAALLFMNFYGDLFEGSYCGATCLVGIGLRLALWLAGSAFILFLISSVFEMILQKNLYLHEQRMTESEVKKETKELAGSPEVKKEQKRLRQELAEAGDSIGVDKANMCFFLGDSCVAIRYHPQLAPVPRVSAKSKTRIKSEAIRKAVEANGFRVMEHEQIIVTCISTPTGGAISEAGQHALINGMTMMFR